MSCNNRVSQFIQKGWDYKEIKLRCGSTSIHGTTLLCESCEEKSTQRYPKGWKNTPGDCCKHGVYLGCHEDNDERLCELCEMGDAA